MTRERAKELWPIIKAFAERKRVMEKSPTGQITEVDEETTWATKSPGFTYYLKPEQKYRPWKPEEVPVGALIKRTDSDKCFAAIITDVRKDGFYFGQNRFYDFKEALDIPNVVISTDSGKTWTPCGVLVEG